MFISKMHSVRAGHGQMPCDCKHRMNDCRMTKKLRITKHCTILETRRQIMHSLVMSCDGQQSAKNMVPDLGGDAKSWGQG
jgi:hypothetical protein